MYAVLFEEVLNVNPNVQDSVVLGLSNEKWEQVMVDYIVKKRSLPYSWRARQILLCATYVSWI